jgi:hypothetical protein
MSHKLHEAWRHLILAEDYEAHMAAIGQAQANAELVAEYFAAFPPKPGAAILFLGAGTGQMFDFVSPAFLAPYRTTFADINAAFLHRLRDRLSAHSAIHFLTAEDDVEHSSLEPGFALVVAVLLLEHVDWRKAVATMCRLTTGSVLTVTQENPQHFDTSITPGRKLPGSLEQLRDIPHELISRAALREEFRLRGFASTHEVARAVADEKKMIASGFEKIS